MPITVLNKGMAIEDAKKLVEDLQQGIALAEKIASRKPETYDPPKQFVVGGVMVGRYVTVILASILSLGSLIRR